MYKWIYIEIYIDIYFFLFVKNLSNLYYLPNVSLLSCLFIVCRWKLRRWQIKRTEKSPWPKSIEQIWRRNKHNAGGRVWPKQRGKRTRLLRQY